MARFDSIYSRLPVWAQHSAVSAYGAYWYWLRFGPRFVKYVEEYTERERLRADEWQKYQRVQLRSILSRAANHVPYYQQTWTRQEKKAAMSGGLEDLPLTIKDSVRDNPDAFVRQDMESPPKLVFHTSGSSGTPIASVWNIEELRMSMALREARSARWAGVSFRMPRATFSGRLVEPNPESRGPFHRFNLVERQVYFSAFHVRPDTAACYTQALWKHGTKWLTGYAVSYYLLANMILEQQLDVPKLMSIITTSEKVTPAMRAVMEKAFGCRVFEEYSTVENALFASECERGRLHVSPDVGVVEILRPDGSRCEAGETGEVVATGLLRQSQPFVRYRLGDLAMWDPEPCPCGRSMPVIKEVVGRVEDVVNGPDGRQLVRFHGVFLDQPNIREGQIIQESLNRIRVKVVPAPGFEPATRVDIARRVQQRLGQVEVIVEPVDQIPRTAAGKFKAVVSYVPRQEAAWTNSLRA